MKLVRPLILLYSVVALYLYCPLQAAILTTDGSASDVQAKINTAVDGDVVTIPAGTFTWTSGVSISGKGIHLRGAGSGRVVGRSTTSLTAETGVKTLATQEGLSISAGQTLRIERTGGVITSGYPTGARAYMVGTVVSYTGTSLTLNVTSVVGSGSHPLWIISTIANTTVIRAIPNGTQLSVAEDASHPVEISGIYFAYGSGSGNVIDAMPISNGRPIQVHDCYAEMVYAGPYSAFFRSYTPRGIVYNSSFIGAPLANGNIPIVINAEQAEHDSWIKPSTMGVADTTGVNNFYIEDCDFHGLQNSTDMSNNARVVIRNCLFNNAGIASHGPDTAYYGLRHFEIYDNEFLTNGYNNGQSLPLPYFIYIRGGTGIITNNIIPDLLSTDFGDKQEIILQMQMLARNAGPNPLWSDNDGEGVIKYPVPRQIGMGHITGSGVDGKGRSKDPSPSNPDWSLGTYVGDSEPLYVWNNTNTYAISVATGFESSGGDAIRPDPASAYVVAGRDYFNNGTPKPGWAKPSGQHPAAYPHPLRGVPRFVQIRAVKQ